MDKKYSLLELAAKKLAEGFAKYRLPFLSALVFGFMGHMYAFANKLLNADEISALFAKGATVTSGRWGLELTKYIFPNVSMPWIYGLISLVLLACAVCVTVAVFDIKSRLLQSILAGCIVCFPAVLGNFAFMFTSAPYALAILLAVLSVRLFTQGGKWQIFAGILLLAFSLGIYQAYISLAASFLVLRLIQMLLDGESALKTLKKGVAFVIFLVAALGIYYAVTFVVDSVGDKGYQDYEFFSVGGIAASFIRAYTSFVRTFFSGYFGYVNSGLSIVAHVVILGFAFFGIAVEMHTLRDRKAALLMLLLIFVFPLSVNCMYLIASVDIIHSLVLFSFVSVYVLAALVLDRMQGRKTVCRDIVSVALAAVLACNVIYCNKVYLKMALQYENAYAFYTTLLTQIMETPGFSRYTVIDFVGSEAWGVTEFDVIDTEMLTGPNDELVNIYTRVQLMKYYLGMDLYSYREDTIHNAPWFDAMPSYPDPGSIVYRAEENRIIIKLC